MSLDEHDKDIHSYGPRVRLYHWYGGGDGYSAHGLGDCILPHRKLLWRYEKASTIFSCKIDREDREI
jgi:hypothetical protein